MYFNKIDHPANFRFCDQADSEQLRRRADNQSFATRIEGIGADVFRLTVTHPRWCEHGSQAELETAIPGECAHRLHFDPTGSIVLEEIGGHRAPLLHGCPGACFGVSGTKWLFQFDYDPAMRFYGLGEHNRGLEKTGRRAKFWNTDLMGDFPLHEIDHGHPNPMYVAVPWLIIRRGDAYVGILVNNPGAVFMNLASEFELLPRDERKTVFVGAPEGNPELYFIVGPSLDALTCKLQTLVGRTPRPPLWALGHHQCRWGYTSPGDLEWLDEQFSRHQIPCDGLWLDIDYMDGYRVFTFDPAHWGNNEAVRASLQKLHRSGRRVIPILDPGVKADPNYDVCVDGLDRNVFCQTPEGLPFVGFVWPGKTYFPDFSEQTVREWWSDLARKYFELGIDGAWLDMNDPSVGAVELDDMRFSHGTRDHSYYHNQYALGMARATRAGCLKARPDQRPFLLSRSAFISSNRHTAVWCGDNSSNWHHLRMSIPVSLGLALSGIPFNGADVCGFGRDTTAELAQAWYKAGFLFPFFRNHSAAHARPQEPWALGADTLRVATRYIRLRYKLLPYLYQLFIQQERTGAAILRPLLHDFADTPELPLDRMEDQFMVGPDIMQAPIAEEEATSRIVALPGNHSWFSACDGRWLSGGTSPRIEPGSLGTPLFVREGALLPLQIGERTSATNDLLTLELHCFLPADATLTAALDYTADDGASFAYQRGAESRIRLSARVTGSQLVLELQELDQSHGAFNLTLFTYAPFTAVVVRQGNRSREFALTPTSVTLTGAALSAHHTDAFTFDH